MGNVQQIDLVKRLAPKMRGSVLEIGSKRYAEPPISFDYRMLFPVGTEYVGVDAEAGTGVDIVLDMTASIDILRARLGQRQYGAIICLSVLEHVKDIFSFSRNVEGLLRPGGVLVLSVPFAWEIHAYPGDYWRFTPEAIRYLFRNVEFDQRLSRFHADWGRTMSLEDAGDDLNRWMMYFSASERADKSALGRLRRIGFSFLRRAFGMKKNMLYSTMFDMVGFKKG
jgi:SAM-dependent methyltransferase